MTRLIKNLIDKDVIESLLDPLEEEIKELTTGARWNENRGHIRMVTKANCLEHLHKDIQEKIEKELNVNLLPTYWFTTQYSNGSFMVPHIDRASCQISVTVNFFKDHDWPINIYQYNHESRLVQTESVELEPGDGLIYNGTHEMHGRPKPFKGEKFIQTFFHYVDADDEFYVNHIDIKRQRECVRNTSSDGTEETGPYRGHAMGTDYNEIREQQNDE